MVFANLSFVQTNPFFLPKLVRKKSIIELSLTATYQQWPLFFVPAERDDPYIHSALFLQRQRPFKCVKLPKELLHKDQLTKDWRTVYLMWKVTKLDSCRPSLIFLSAWCLFYCYIFTCTTYLYATISLFLLPFAFQNPLLVAQERQLAIIHQPLQNTWKWPGKEADVKVWSEADKAMQVIETVNFDSFEQLSVTPFCETGTLLLCLCPQEERLGFVFVSMNAR